MLPEYMDIEEDDDEFPDIPLVINSVGKFLARVSDTKQFFQERTPKKTSKVNSGPYKVIGPPDCTPEIVLKTKKVPTNSFYKRLEGAPSGRPLAGPSKKANDMVDLTEEVDEESGDDTE
jgi:hypothetical protein